MNYVDFLNNYLPEEFSVDWLTGCDMYITDGNITIMLKMIDSSKFSLNCYFNGIIVMGEGINIYQIDSICEFYFRCCKIDSVL